MYCVFAVVQSLCKQVAGKLQNIIRNINLDVGKTDSIFNINLYRTRISGVKNAEKHREKRHLTLAVRRILVFKVLSLFIHFTGMQSLFSVAKNFVEYQPLVRIDEKLF